jgi:hypothetical protein
VRVETTTIIRFVWFFIFIFFRFRGRSSMSKHMQVYYHAIFGALGGLLGWWIMGGLNAQTWNIWLYASVMGSGLGLCIGGMIAATDGAMVKRVSKRAIRDGAIGAFSGAVAGMMGLILAQIVWSILTGGFVARAVAWMLLGLLIGIGDVIVSQQVRRASYAAIGGLVGGIVGGLIYEGLTQLFLTKSGTTQIVVGGLGLIIIGACIGGLIPFARQVLSRGEIRVTHGEQTGLVREVTDRTSIGKYDGNDLYLPDGGVSWRHAVVSRAESGFVITVLEQSEAPVTIGGQGTVGGMEIAPGMSHSLHNGDEIRIGEAVLVFLGR